jgi:CheY-like chemotaxis protein
MTKKILVVDDEPDILKVVIFRLKKAGYEIVNATNGREALDLLQCGTGYDLIVLDLVMPVMDGYELCKRLKADEKTKYIPILILSASTTRDIKQRIMELKVNDYILKPFEPEILVSRIKSIIG